MRRFLAFWGFVVALSPPVFAQDLPARVGESLGGVQDSSNAWLQDGLKKVIVLPPRGKQPLLSIDTELAAVAKFVTTQANPAEVPFLRFFTFYALPTDPAYTIGVGGAEIPISLRQAGLLGISSALNSTAHVSRSLGNITTPTMLPGSSTICYINISDFGWTPDQWDRISRTDPYICEPLVSHSSYNLNRLAGGNLLFRGDWFITHALDPQRQTDAKISELIYYTLLFDRDIPKNATEFRKALRIDLAGALQDNLDRRAILEAGRSGVSVETGGNRKIQGVRTPWGYYWETFDTKSADFLNNLDLDDKIKDAGEIIASHKNGNQIYFLVNQDDNRVDFADNGLVEYKAPFGKKTSHPIDRRIKTGATCMDCHPNGLNPVENSVLESILEGVQLNVLVRPQHDTYKDYQEFRRAREKYVKLDRKYVNNGINPTIEADNRIYEQAVRQANGLIPSQNAYLLWAVRDWYDHPLDLNQAALECGLTSADYIEKTRGSISARVNRIVASDKFSIPRRYWENLNPAGDYAYSVLTIKLHNPDLVRVAMELHPGYVSPASEKSKPAPHAESKEKRIIAVRDCPVVVTVAGVERMLGMLRAGEKISYISFDGTWYQVAYSGQTGFVFKQNCAEEG